MDPNSRMKISLSITQTIFYFFTLKPFKGKKWVVFKTKRVAVRASPQVMIL